MTKKTDPLIANLFDSAGMSAPSRRFLEDRIAELEEKNRRLVAMIQRERRMQALAEPGPKTIN